MITTNTKEALTVVLPIVHTNGTSKNELIDLRCKASSALANALDSLYAMGPNQRDYYPEPDRWRLAQAQHERRINVLRNLLHEIQTETNLLDEVAS